MPYTVDLSLPTPKELAVATQAARESTWGMRYPPRRPAPLRGWIRVRFYSHIYKIRYNMLPDMEGEVMLHSSGGLDTRIICKMWNLEDCMPIDPMRWIPFERSDPNWLSPMAVRILSEQTDCLMFIEPTPTSAATFHKRTFREATIHLYNSVYLFGTLSCSLVTTSTSSCVTVAEKGAGVVVRRWNWLDERLYLPEQLGRLFKPIYRFLCWLMLCIIESRAGTAARSIRVSCKKRYRAVMNSWRTLWVKEQMPWIVLMFCLGMLVGSMFLLLGAFRPDTRYKTMLDPEFRQPLIWARQGASGGIVGDRGESLWI